MISRYLEAIYYMWSEGEPLRSARLADWLGVSRPTVTIALRRMARDGLVKLTRTKDIELTNVSDTACCTVANGNCKLKTSINTEVFDALRLGERAGIELLGCGLRRRDGPTPPTDLTFVCGMLAP